ncbi:triphosphoribosyl-dephospho-CoA synthase [Escherichia coli]
MARGPALATARGANIIKQWGHPNPADLDYLRQFDRECIERNISPGGSADLLILTWFLAQI